MTSSNLRLHFDPACYISEYHIPRILMDEWKRSYSISKLKSVIEFHFNEGGFDINAKDGNGYTVLDKICCNIYNIYVAPPVIALLVEAGARPELTDKYDIITRCFYHFRMAWLQSKDSKVDRGALIDCVATLLTHGAKLNDVHWTDSGVRLHSDSLNDLINGHGLIFLGYELVILLLVHGACLDNSVAVVEFLPCKASRDDAITRDYRLLRYLRFAGFELRFSRYTRDDSDNIERTRAPQVFKDMLAYAKTFEPPPESLRFQCRRVVRQQMAIAADGKSILDGIDDLEIPVTLHDYLKLKDAEQIS